MKARQTYRFTKQEIILRFLALYDNSNTYEGHLAKFLNAYMQEHQHGPESFIEEKRALFRATVNCVAQKAFAGGTPKLSLTVLEAVLVGVARNLEVLKEATKDVVAARFHALIGHQDFSELSLKEGLSKKPRVIARLNTAVRIFAGA
jgi:hypothetical protein